MAPYAAAAAKHCLDRLLRPRETAGRGGALRLRIQRGIYLGKGCRTGQERRALPLDHAGRFPRGGSDQDAQKAAGEGVMPPLCVPPSVKSNSR